MNIAILGFGAEGRAAAEYWYFTDHKITICDRDPNLEVMLDVHVRLGPDYLQNLAEFDLIVRSPGVRPSAILAANPDLDATKITSGTNEFLAECPAKIIGVTGTKGKGTTASLICKILETAGHRSHLGGNIGTPALDLLPAIEPDDWVVLELSSFQLIDIRRSPHVAVMLMIAPDHQDWHPDMDEYVAAKQGIFKFQQPGDRAIYNACNLYSLRAGLGAPGDQMGYNASEGVWVDGDQVKVKDTVICSVDDIALIGRHNWDNVCAAVAATWPIVQDPAPIKQAIKAFKGLEHRLEPVAEAGGVTYINDSYSSNPSPTLAALQAFDQPKVLILGGSRRHLSYEGLARAIKQSNVRQVIIIGAISSQITAALDQVGFSDYILGAADMTEIVAAAAKAARPGDVVLLSPGAPSFDMFKNFKQRGASFKRAVGELA